MGLAAARTRNDVPPHRIPTRTLPSLVHRAKEPLAVRRSPCIFAWTECHLFVTKEKQISPSVASPASRPRHLRRPTSQYMFRGPGSCFHIMLSIARCTWRRRTTVRGPTSSWTANLAGLFFTRALTQGALLQPIGCITKTDRDLGGWVESRSVTVPVGRSIVQLDRRRERFDPEDDYDVSRLVTYDYWSDSSSMQCSPSSVSPERGA